MLVGNMSDLVDDGDQDVPKPRNDRRRSKGKKREVSAQEAREFAEQEG